MHAKLRRLLPLLGLATFLACAETIEQPRVARAINPIQGGVLDGSGHPNVVAIMINGPAGNGGLCSGTLIAKNLVLTAHHCVAPVVNNMCASNSFGTTYANSAFAITSSPTLAAQFFNSGFFPTINNFQWFGVNAVRFPSSGNICGGDMAVLELPVAMTGICPAIPRVDSPVTFNENYTAVGFGVTSPTGTAAGTRYVATNLNVQCSGNCGGGTSSVLEWVGGSTAQRGTCEGDSGGPSLDSLGRITGTVSRGPGNACNSTVYESVYGNSTWLKSVAQTAATNGGYTRAGWVVGGATSNINNGYCGANDGGTGGGGGGSNCPMGLVCADATGMGNYECLDPNTINGFPPTAPSCSATVACPSGSSCWLASMGATTGSCLVNCSVILPDGGMSGTGGGGGSNLPGRGSCSVAGRICFDASGQGDFVCLDPTIPNGFPANAPVCSGTMACPSGNSCWLQMAGATSGNCLENCIPDGGTAGGSGGTGGGSGAAGGAGGSGGAGCPTGQNCVNANGMGTYACIDPTTTDGFPASAPACNGTMACPSGFRCWQNGSGVTRCLKDCVGGTAGGSGGTGGGTGGTAGGGTGGTAGGGTGGTAGGGTGGTAGGNTATAGGTGGTAGGNTATAGGTGGTAGGNTATAGGTGGTAGGNTATAGGTGGTAGGNNATAGGDGTAGGAAGTAGGNGTAGSGATAGGDGNLPPGGSTGCGCTQGADLSSMSFLLFGLIGLRRRRRG